MGTELKTWNCGKFGRKVMRYQWKKWQKEQGYNKRFVGADAKETWNYHLQFTWQAFLAAR